MKLFNSPLLRRRSAAFEISDDQIVKSQKIIQNWVWSLQNSDMGTTKEKSVQSQFLARILEDCLGYSTQSAGAAIYSLIPELSVTGGSADAALGFYSKTHSETIVTVELKDASTALDKKQIGRERRETPVEQGYRYANKLDSCRWILISNFTEVRLYSKFRSEEYFETFQLQQLDDPEQFRRFYYTLCRDNLVGREDSVSEIEDLLRQSVSLSEEITKLFYREYGQCRQDLFTELADNNPDVARSLLLEKAQKILDRVIFVAFCEDSSRRLLPTGTIDSVLRAAENSFEQDNRQLWWLCKGLFKSIDIGNQKRKPAINAYNGGLFATDLTLDNLILGDTVLRSVLSLSRFDFESELNVNLLGHVFEQSIADIEVLKAELDGVVVDPRTRRRKRDGIFYTPEYITRYIVEQTLGAYLAEYPQRLEGVRVLDIAVGSGAFLNQAHKYLKNIYAERRAEMEFEALETAHSRPGRGGHGDSPGLFEATNGQLEVRRDLSNEWAYANDAALLRQLYGVDVNDESVEITKLSLWLATARNSEPLTRLDSNIMCGNSLIEDSSIAGPKAFSWSSSFADVGDGFDIVIGNPPYVDSENMVITAPTERAYITKTYRSASGNWDLFVPFIERGLTLLKAGGYLGFIVPNKVLGAGYANALRHIVDTEYALVEIADISRERIFDDGDVYPVVLIIRKATSNGNIQVTRSLDPHSTESVVYSGVYSDNWTEYLSHYRELTDHLGTFDKLGAHVNAFNAATVSEAYALSDLLTDSYTVPSANLRVVNTGTIDPFVPLWGISEMRYLGATYLRPSVAATDAPRKPWITRPRIIVAGMATKVEAFADPRCDYLAGKSTVVVCVDDEDELYYVCGILNSRVISVYYTQLFSSEAMAGGYLNFKPKNIDKLPYVAFNPASTLHSRIASVSRALSDEAPRLRLTALQAEEFLKATYGAVIPRRKSGGALGGTFATLLTTTKRKLSVSDKEQLYDWFVEKSSSYGEQLNVVRLLGEELDELTLALYGASSLL